MHKTIQWFQIIILAGLFLIFPEPDALSKTYRLTVSGSRLSVDFQNAPLSTVIADIGAKTGIKFVFLGGAAAAGYDTPSSFRFESLPIRKGLEKLLSGFNCSFISDGSDNIRQVFILGAKSSSGSGSKTPPPFIMAESTPLSVEEKPDQSPEGMQITSGEGMQIEPGEGMQITPGKGMQIGPPSEKGMEISSGEGMVIGSPDPSGPPEGMVIESPDPSGPPEGMAIGSPESQDASSSAQDAEERVVNSPAARTSPRPPVRRPGRWPIRKK